MWLDLSAAQNQENAIELRDQVAQSMTPDQIAQAQKMATQWAQQHPQNNP